jgi:single-stranded-DNA-specific exonuclease
MLVQVLYNRGVSDPADVQSFMANRWAEADVFLLPDMKRAVDVLIRAIRRKEQIAVYGDFDADGVTATALLVQTLTALGADVMPYIPKRVDEGYGLNLDALRYLYGQGVRLVVTVDCGIRAVDEIEQARRGLEFIVTDHHSVGPRLPFASAVINPKRADSKYPFRDLAGVGVAFKLAQALIRETKRIKRPVHIEERDLLDLVAIGTVADLVPLLGENRYLVEGGLGVINEARREGLRALLRVSGVRPGDAIASSIGFGLGPRLNAAGRLGDASLSYDLLVSCDPREADQLAGRLNEQNRARKTLTEQAYDLAEELALARGEDTPLLFAADKTFMSGVVGLVAGRLTEAYYRPAVVVEQGEEKSKGSCRSIKEFHITEALDECADLLVRHGGHAAAAGFTVRNEELDVLVDRLLAIAERELADQDLVPTLSIDADVALDEINWATAEWLHKLEPCGYANPPALFVSRNVPLVDAKSVGSEGQHLKLVLKSSQVTYDAIGFRMGERLPKLSDRIDVAYHLEVNEWHGERRLQLNVQDIRPAEA